MKKLLIAVLMLCLVFASFSFVACGKDDDEDEPSDTSITVTDQIGRTVTVDSVRERIVSGYYISSSACIALGLEDKLVGIETGMDSRPIYGLATELSYDKVKNVGSGKVFDQENALASNPDLAILPKAHTGYVDAFTEVGVPVIIVNPESHEGLVEMIEMIAKLTGKVAKANELIAYYNEILDKVEDLTKDIAASEKPKVYISSPSSFLSTAPKDMYQASLIASSGGINAGKDLTGSSWTPVSNEQVAAMNPDIIIIPTNNNADEQPDYAETFMNDEVFAEITAVVNEAIYTMPVGLEAWDSPVPSGILGLLWMVSVIHPDLYTIDELVVDATEFYQTFYGFTLDASILTGTTAD